MAAEAGCGSTAGQNLGQVKLQAAAEPARQVRNGGRHLLGAR
jgi:hypothetical protein